MSVKVDVRNSDIVTERVPIRATSVALLRAHTDIAYQKQNLMLKQYSNRGDVAYDNIRLSLDPIV